MAGIETSRLMPMFQSVRFAEQVGVAPPADQATVIQAMLSQKLDFDPGERYAYSNFGYCLLGRVIETTDGPDLRSVRARNTSSRRSASRRCESVQRVLKGRAEHEVRYYHPGTGTSVFADDLNRNGAVAVRRLAFGSDGFARRLDRVGDRSCKVRRRV